MPFICVGIASLFIIYQWLAFNQYLPFYFISLRLDHFIPTVMNGVALNWAIVVGVVGLLYAISGFFILKEETGQPYKIGMFGFYLFYCILLIL